MVHRGPDDHGIYQSKSAGLLLGHRRLSIIDLSSMGHQPMEDQDSGSVLTYNGEIYNAPELKVQLEREGITFRGHSDTEILLKLLIKKGAAGLSLVRGMFAFAWWDPVRETLTLSRDRVGKKSLYYTRVNEIFYFASEITALTAMFEKNSLEIDNDSLIEYFQLGVIGHPRTIYKDIKLLPPGCFMELTTHSQKIEQYWQIDWLNKEKIDQASAVEKVDKLLNRAVKERLRADVPVGIFLSGGIDSGLITAMAASSSNNKLTTLCVGSEDSQYDERMLARQVSKRYETNHIDICIEADVKNDVAKIIQNYGQPFSDPSAIPSYYVSKFASEHATVVLNGDGGDELFLGYRRFVAARLLSNTEKNIGFLSKPITSLLKKMLPLPITNRSKYAFIHRLIRASNENFNDSYRILGNDGFSKKDFKLFCGLDIESPKIMGQTNLDLLQNIISVDFEHALPDALLVKMDIASMNHSIEARSPFLDHDLVQFAFSLPNKVLLPGMKTKPVLRQLAKRYLPEDIINAPKKGFEIPLNKWLKGSR